jgi:hypothetical protein
VYIIRCVASTIHGVRVRLTLPWSSVSHAYCREPVRQSCSEDIMMTCTPPSSKEYQKTLLAPEMEAEALAVPLYRA